MTDEIKKAIKKIQKNCAMSTMQNRVAWEQILKSFADGIKIKKAEKIFRDGWDFGNSRDDMDMLDDVIKLQDQDWRNYAKQD